MASPSYYNVSKGDKAIVDINGKINYLSISDATPYFIVAETEKNTLVLDYEELVVRKSKTGKVFIGKRALERFYANGFGGLRLLI